MSNKVLLEAKNITKQFPGVLALNGVNFTLFEGEIHALLGENGAGKSTLIKVITGVESLSEGTVNLDGKNISPKTPEQAQELGISTVYQEVNLCPNLSVAENIFIGRDTLSHDKNKKGKLKFINWKEMNLLATNLLRRLDIEIDVTKSLDEYPVAIQQMVAIARAINIKAKVLILDEPTSSLNQLEVEKLFEIMRMLKENNMGIIFVTHFLDQVYSVCDKITILRNGSLVGEFETKNLRKAELVGKMIGKEYDKLYIEKTDSLKQVENKEAFISLEKVVSSKLPKELSFDINKNEVLGLAGLLGSGRTEISNLIFGIDKLKSGAIKINKAKAKINKPIDAIRNNIGYCPEDRKTEGIVADLSIKENIVIALQAKRGMFNFIARKEQDKIADKYIKMLSIKTPSKEQLIKNLSGGNQQKVMLARWLATNPELLILDEPTRGIDIGTKAEIQKLVAEFSKDGMSVIFISSELDEMIRSCTRIVVLENKKIIDELNGNQINENTIMNKMAGGENIEKNI